MEGKEDVRTVAPHPGSQKTAEDTRVVGNKASRRNSAASMQQTRSDSLGIKAATDRQRKSSGRTAAATVTPASEVCGKKGTMVWLKKTSGEHIYVMKR